MQKRKHRENLLPPLTKRVRGDEDDFDFGTWAEVDPGEIDRLIAEHLQRNRESRERKMNEEQRRAMKAIVDEKKSIFLTGAAGTGKSTLLKMIIEEFNDQISEKKLDKDGFAVTSSSGSSACLIGGRTIHSFAGIATGDGSFDELLNMVNRSSAYDRWRNIQILVIDEGMFRTLFLYSVYKQDRL